MCVFVEAALTSEDNRRTSRFESKETDRLTRARARLSYVESGFGYGWCVRSVATVSTSCVED